MPSIWTRTLATASTVTSTASALTSLGFGAAKASTKLGFSIAQGIASITPIPLLSTSLTHLENLSLLPILLGESIASTSLTAASTSLDLISNLLDAEDEASFSLATFVSLVRKEWAEYEAAGRGVTEVARAVAAWAAIQGFTKQWSEERWFKSVKELKPDDFKPPDKPKERKTEIQRARRRAISRVSVTNDVIMSGRLGQVVSADIGEKEPTAGTTTPPVSIPNGSTRSARASSPAPYRSNYETRNNLRRLSKMVLAGYGGAGLLFFGAPLQPLKPESVPSQPSASKHDRPSEPRRSDTEVKDSEEDILVHVVEDAEAEAMSPPLRNLTLPDEPPLRPGSNNTPPHTTLVNPAPEPSPTAPSSTYSWWNVLLGKHDREIFEGFAFTPADESDRDSLRSPLTPYSALPSPAPNTFRPRRGSFFDVPPTPSLEGSRKGKESQPHTAMIGDMSSMPRFWVLTDHGRRQVVLVVRGTMSFNELAADLTCEPESFEPATATSPPTSRPAQDTHEPQTGPNNTLPPQRQARAGKDLEVPLPTANPSPSLPEENAEASDIEAHMPGFFRVTPPVVPTKGRFANHHASSGSQQQPNGGAEPLRPFPQSAVEDTDDEEASQHQVHGGILRLARAMGSKGKPVHQSVSTALLRNRGYELVLCGHSLGAGVAALLALMWADPTTCRTVPSSGLPPNRRVSVYCFAPPCITSPSLSRLCKNLITSIVYSFDVVSRLSLGSIRDLNRAAFWLCEGKGDESTVSVLRRALSGKIGFGAGSASHTEEEKTWFIALRKTLEANMYFSHLFPPGRVWWAVRDEALHPSHQGGTGIGPGLRLYEVQQVEEVFRQIEFKGDMLSSHLPHQYDRMLTELDF